MKSTRHPFRLPALLLIAFATLAALAPPAAQACSIPVFRYALQFWKPDAYETIVFHRGPLSDADAKIVDRLAAVADPDRGANVNVQRIDLSGEVDAPLKELWKRFETSRLPHVLTLYPRSYGPAVPAESVSLTELELDHWSVSPARKTIIERLARGETAVWVLLEIGDPEKDNAAATTLESSMKKLEKTLELPEQVPEPDLLFETGLDVQSELRIAFSTLRLSRSDPAERHFVSQLLSSEEDLGDFQEPMVFAAFGRGRMMPALIGKGINESLISEVASFLVGPCSCQVKAQNPGFDLFVAADWEALLQQANAALSSEVTAAAAATGTVEVTSNRPAAVSATAVSTALAPGDTAPGDTTPGDAAPGDAAPASEALPRTEVSLAGDREPERAPASRPFLQGILLLVCGGLAVLLAATVIVLKRKTSVGT